MLESWFHPGNQLLLFQTHSSDINEFGIQRAEINKKVSLGSALTLLDELSSIFQFFSLLTPACLFVHSFVYHSLCMSVCCLSDGHLSVCRSVCLFVSLSVCLCHCPKVLFPLISALTLLDELPSIFQFFTHLTPAWLLLNH